MKKTIRSLAVTSLLFLISIVCYAGDTLVRASSAWKYLDNGSDQGTAWYQSGFNDSAWITGFAKFGYGEGNESTIINYGSDPNNKYITTYFRDTFTVLNNQIYRGMRLYLKRDDGAVVYLNGQEIYRSNFSADTINYDTQADFAIEPGSEEYFVPVRLDATSLISGLNVVAVEIHQCSHSSDDLSFDLCLVGDMEAELMRGPYLQNATTQSMKVCYRTSFAEISKVYYGVTTAYTDSVIDTAQVIDHIVTLNGLTSGTKYYYSVRTSAKEIAGDTTCYFYSVPDSNSRQPVRIWAMADFGSGNLHQLATRNAYDIYSYNKYTNIVLWGGDNAYPWGNDEDYSANVFTNHYEDILKRSVVYSALGNHELFTAGSVTDTGIYYNVFSFPVNGEGGGVPSGKESYYSFNYSNIHFVCLNSNIDSIGVVNASYMIDWLRLDLSANTLPWVIVYFHAPPYSKGYHDSDVGNEETFLRQNIVPVLDSADVDLVLTGHSHDYERSYLIKGHYGISTTFNPSVHALNYTSGSPSSPYMKIAPNDSGTVYAVIGNTSEITPVQPDWPHPAMYCSIDSVYGSFIVEVDGDTLHAKMLTDSMVVADEFAIVKNISTGIRSTENNQTAYFIFPQPVDDELSIHSKRLSAVKGISIYDGTGRVVKKLSPGILRVDVKNLMRGIYFIRINDDIGIYTLKFVKN
jgi:hypothetical protein